MLVYLWAAAGLIEAECEEESERIAFLCIDQLVELKYLLPSNYNYFTNQFSYRVTNAPSLDPRFDRRLNKTNRSNISRLEHLSLKWMGKNYLSIKALKKCCRLKTLILRGNLEYIPSDLFEGLTELRALDMSCSSLRDLPDSVKKLESLKYLDISETMIRCLPERICHVTKLETLRVGTCLSDYELPVGISKLIHLQFWDFKIVGKLNSLPEGFGNLAKLRTLDTFPVGEEGEARLGELMNLNDLRGSLRITQLQNVKNAEDAKRASLHTKKKIKELRLIWNYCSTRKDTTIDENVLEYLRPHCGLEELSIVHYMGTVLPSWICSPSLSSIVKISICTCDCGPRLPSLGQLPSLKFLNISRMKVLSDINGMFCRALPADNDFHAFPKLEELQLQNMSSLESWTGVQQGDFPCLLDLEITSCPRLITIPRLSSIGSLKYVRILECPVLPSCFLQDIPSNTETVFDKDVSMLAATVEEMYIDYDKIPMN